MGKTLQGSTTIATLPGDFNGVVFSLAVPHGGRDVALLGVVAAHTSLRAMWGAMHHYGYSHAHVQVLGERYHLDRDLAVVAKGTQDKAEWWLLAKPNVVPNAEESVRAYVGRKWPLPPQPLLPVLDSWMLEAPVGRGEYLAVPPVDSDTWKLLIRRVIVGEDSDIDLIDGEESEEVA
jgi:hypothetical protein